MSPARTMVLLFSACAVMAAGIVGREGWKLKAYPDPVHGAKVPTACAGVTEGVVLGRTYTEAECIQMTMLALVKHAAPIAECIPPDFVETFPGPRPDVFLGEQGDAAYNFGVGNYKKGSLCSRFRAKDYKGACDAILLYKYSGKLDCTIRSNQCYGVWTRRLEQHENCMKALH